ncbi:MAG: insulinase family protein [Treponema sp.]|nr:insulinase family protein [Treponema sp.]
MKKIIKIILGLAVIFFLAGCATKKGVESEKPVVSAPEKSGDLKWNNQIKNGTLDNGMAFYVMKNGEPKNRITLRLVVKAGSAMEEDDQKGVAHFVEHMAFNGTKNFEKSAIVDYFEKIGMGFGPEINAYTSFEETVYMLEIPADNPQILKTSLQVLHDWASAITFDSVEVEKERGVITEEWRLSQGLNHRITEKQTALLLKDSIFKDRLPIGDMETVKNVSRNRIVDFYKKWYRPENMAIVAVGDLDEKTLEAAIKEAMKDIPASKTKEPLPQYSVPVSKDKEVCILKDKEQNYTVVNIYFRENRTTAVSTKEEMKQNLIMQMASSILNERYQTLSMQSDSPWLVAQIGEYNLTNKSLFGFLGVVPKEGKFTQALTLSLEEFDRFRLYGVTESELQRNKQIMLTQEELNYKNKDKIESASHASNILQYELIGKTVLSETEIYNLYNQIIPSLTLKDFNNAVKELFNSKGQALFVVTPDETANIPSEKEIKQIWEKDNSKNLVAQKEEVIVDNGLMEKPEKKARVVSTKALSDIDAKQYVLSNGIKIIAKKTDFQTNIINMKAVSWGGTNYVSDADFPSSQVAFDYAVLSGINGMSYTELTKKISTKKMGCSGLIAENKESIEGISTQEDLEYLLQYVNLIFTKPQFTEEGWNVLMSYINTQAAAYGKQPSEVFMSEIKKQIYGNDIRYSDITPEFAAKMKKETAEKIYRERFGNAADFSFVFVGDYNEKKLLDLCCTYLGSIETNSSVETAKDLTKPFPAGKKVSTVKKGIEKQGMVYIAFGGKFPVKSPLKEDFYEMKKLSLLEKLLEIRLREVIREDKGGSYGVNVYCGYEGTSNRNYSVQISFGCEPEREQELIQEVFNQIEIIKNELVSNEYIQKLTETTKREYETNYRNNAWIMSNIENSVVLGITPENFYNLENDVIKLITPQVLKDTANKYLNTNNYVNVNLIPEEL